METESKIETFQVDYICPKCGEGFLRPSGICLPTNPPQYPHFCNKKGCDYSETFSNKTYPYLTYKSC